MQHFRNATIRHNRRTLGVDATIKKCRKWGGEGRVVARLEKCDLCRIFVNETGNLVLFNGSVFGVINDFQNPREGVRPRTAACGLPCPLIVRFLGGETSLPCANLSGRGGDVSRKTQSRKWKKIRLSKQLYLV